MTPGGETSRVLVTGGGGFLGRAIIDRLLDRGLRVRSFSRGDYPDLAARGVEVHRGDIADAAAVLKACDGCDAVFHAAGKPGMGGFYDDFHRPNCLGTENILAACRQLGVSRLIYTSSPSVIFDEGDMENIDESTPYPDHYPAHYPKTKAIAEKAVLAANDRSLATVALRPHLLWGPGDNHLAPRLIHRAKTLRRIGSANKLVDCLYIDNAADAHLLAYDRLTIGSPIAGRAYFLSQGEPRGVWDLINGILAAADLPPVTKSIPFAVAYAAGAISEIAYRCLARRDEPRFTRFLVGELSTAHWFNITAARRDLNYEPKVSIDEGMERLRTWLKGGGAVG